MSEPMALALELALLGASEATWLVGWASAVLAPCLPALGPETGFQPRDTSLQPLQNPCLAIGGPLPLRLPLGSLSITQGEVNRHLFTETLAPASYRIGSGARGRLL